MKENNSFIWNTIWGKRRIGLLIVLSVWDAVLSYLINYQMHSPLHIFYFGILLCACIGGPVYGIAAAILSTSLQLALGWTSIHFVFILEGVAVAVFIGVYTRMGFFAKKRYIFIGVLLCSLLQAFMNTSIHLALHGGWPRDQIWYRRLLEVLQSIGCYTPVASFLSFFVVGLLNEMIVLYMIYLLLKKLPDRLKEIFAIEKEFPEVTIVGDASEEEFLNESERIKAKAQEKLDKKKAEAGKS